MRPTGNLRAKTIGHRGREACSHFVTILRQLSLIATIARSIVSDGVERQRELATVFGKRFAELSRRNGMRIALPNTSGVKPHQKTQQETWDETS
jgi:hypothetical protein